MIDNGEFNDGWEQGACSTVIVTLVVVGVIAWGLFKFGILYFKVPT